MFGFIRENDLVTHKAVISARLKAIETTSAQSQLRCEELHEMTSRLIKRFETRQQRSKEKEGDWPDDDQPGGLDSVTARVMARRGNRRFNGV
jgi:hypothetical protein